LECPYDLAIPLPGIYTKGWKSAQNRDTSTLTVIAELFTIPKLLNQTKCPSTYEQIMKMCHIYTMEYYSVINNKIMLFGKSGWNCIMLNEISQTEKGKYCMFFLIWRMLTLKK
jgi:hypothetical protein